MRPARVTPRPGHSLPELIVAVTFLGVALSGVSAATLLGARWAADAQRRQEAGRVAAAVFDSVATAADPRAGSRDSPRWRVRWTLEADHPALVVTVETLHGRRLARIDGRVVPRVPVLPDPPGREDE